MSTNFGPARSFAATSERRAVGGARLRRRLPAGLPQVLIYAFLGAMAVYYLANIYHAGIAAELKRLKWACLIVLLGIGVLYLKTYWRLLRGKFNLNGAIFLLLIIAITIPSATDRTTAIFVFCSIAIAVVTGRVLATAFGSPEASRRFFDLVLLIGQVVIASAAVMWAAGISLGRGGGVRFTAWTDNPNTLALMMAPAMVVMMARIIERGRGWATWHAGFLLAGLVLLKATDSRAGLLWIVVSGAAFWAFRKGITISSLFAIAGLTMVLGWWNTIVPALIQLVKREHGSKVVVDVLSGRSEVWPLAVKLAREKPVLGHGLGSSQPLIESNLEMFREFQGGTFHNAYLTALVETGFVGAVVFVTVLIVATAGGLVFARRVRRAPPGEWPTLALPWVILVGALAHALFESALFAAGNANSILIWTIIWMLCDAWHTRPPRKQVPYLPMRR